MYGSTTVGNVRSTGNRVKRTCNMSRSRMFVKSQVVNEEKGWRGRGVDKENGWSGRGYTQGERVVGKGVDKEKWGMGLGVDKEKGCSRKRKNASTKTTKCPDKRVKVLARNEVWELGQTKSKERRKCRQSEDGTDGQE